MDSNSLLTIVGIGITIIVGSWAIYIAIRNSQKVELTYIEEQCLSLIDDITQGITDLKISFRDSPVSQNIVLLKGYIINTGRRDVSQEMVEKRLHLILPEGFEWIDCQITNRSNDLKIKVSSIEKESVEFEFGLLKTQEYFKFDAIATVPINKNNLEDNPPNIKLRKALEFDFRIVDLHEIQKIKLNELRTGISFSLGLTATPSKQSVVLADRILRPFRSIWMPIFLILVGIFFYFIFSFSGAKDIAYEIDGPKEQTITVNTRVKDGQIELHNQEGFRKELSLKEFNDLKKIAVLQSYEDRSGKYMALSYIFLGLLVLLRGVYRFIRIRKYRQILPLEESY